MHGLVLMIQCVYGILSTKVANIGQQGKRALLFICIRLYLVNYHSDSSGMTNYRCVFSTTDRHRKLNQLRWQNMSAHLTNETSYWLKKFLMHLNWAIINVCDLNIDPHVCLFPNLSQDRARSILLAQPEVCPQRSDRPVCARSPHRSRNDYPGCLLKLHYLCFTLLTSMVLSEFSPRYISFKCISTGQPASDQ